jgi:tetratricopeptide (TPR) repeat protein
MSELFADVALNFKQMRLARSWTPEELAEKAGLPVEAVLAYEADPASLTSRVATKVLDIFPLMVDEGEEMLDSPEFPSQAPPWLDIEMEARVLEWGAALSIDHGRFRQALDELGRAVALHPWPQRLGQLLLSKAEVLGELGRERHALEALHEAEGYLNVAEEPHLWLRLRINQMYFLCHQEKYDEAEAYREEARELTARIGRDRERLQLLSLEGRIAAGCGRWQEALDLLQPAREELIAVGKLFEAGCTTFDVASVLVDQGKLAELAELARQMEPWGQDKKLSDASRSTLRLFCRMVAQGSFKPGMGRRFAADFRKTDTRLTRPFEIPGEQGNGNESAALREHRTRIAADTARAEEAD